MLPLPIVFLSFSNRVCEQVLTDLCAVEDDHPCVWAATARYHFALKNYPKAIEARHKQCQRLQKQPAWTRELDLFEDTALALSALTDAYVAGSESDLFAGKLHLQSAIALARKSETVEIKNSEYYGLLQGCVDRIAQAEQARLRVNQATTSANTSLPGRAAAGGSSYMSMWR